MFQYIAKDENHKLEVIYTNSERMKTVFDPELNMQIDWGIDLLSGYSYAVLPKNNWKKWLKQKISGAKYDLIIINGYNKLAFLYSILYGKRSKTRIALRLDTVEFNNRTFLKKLYKKFLFTIFNNVFDHFFAVGSLTSNYLKSLGIKQNKISFFSYVVDNKYFEEGSALTNDQKVALRKEYNIHEEDRVILSVAKFNEREAPWDLLRAFCEFGIKNAHLLLVGEGELRNELENYGKKYCHSRKITFTGYVKYIDLPKIYGISDLFVHCSHREPWGVSVQEAIASGLPVITSNKVGAAVDLLKENENGFVYNVGDCNDLTRKIKMVFEISRNKIKETDKNILCNWNYAITWSDLLKVAESFHSEQKK